MISKYFLLIYFFLLVILVFGDDDEDHGHHHEDAKEFMESVNILCKSKLDDSAIGNIMSNCNFGKLDDAVNWSKISDEAMMNCTEKTTLTDRERLTAFCDQTVSHCYFEGMDEKCYEALGGKEPSEEVTKLWAENALKSKECIKQYIPKESE